VYKAATVRISLIWSS